MANDYEVGCAQCEQTIELSNLTYSIVDKLTEKFKDQKLKQEKLKLQTAIALTEELHLNNIELVCSINSSEESRKSFINSRSRYQIIDSSIGLKEFFLDPRSINKNSAYYKGTLNNMESVSLQGRTNVGDAMVSASADVLKNGSDSVESKSTNVGIGVSAQTGSVDIRHGKRDTEIQMPSPPGGLSSEEEGMAQDTQMLPEKIKDSTTSTSISLTGRINDTDSVTVN